MSSGIPETRKTTLPVPRIPTSGEMSGYDEQTRLRVDQLRSSNFDSHWRVYCLTLISGIGGFLFGYDTGVMSGALLLLRENYDLDYMWQEAMVSATIASAAIFSLVAGPLNDSLGRKRVLMISSALFCAGSGCMAWAEVRYTLLFGRLLVGAGIGFTSTTTPMYIAESAPPGVRGRLVSANVVLIAFGQLVSNIVAGVFSNDTLNGWRYMLGLGALPAVVQFLGILFMPESPRWLTMKGRTEDARQVLQSIRGDVDVQQELSSIEEFCLESTKEKEARKESCILYQMVTTPSTRRALVVGCGVQAIQQLAGINTVMYYSATIVKMSGVRGGSDAAAIWLSALVAATNFAFTFVGVYLVEKIGRRFLIIASLMGAIISLIWLSGGFYLSSLHSPVIKVHSGDVADGDTCGSYLTCNGCTIDPSCGYCYTEQTRAYPSAVNVKLLYTSVSQLNGSCINADSSHPNTPPMRNSCPDTTLLLRNWAYDYCPSPYAWMTLAGLVLYLIFFAPGMGPMPWTINSEIYPMWARSTGNSASTFVNWTCNLLVSMTFLTLTQVLTKHGAFCLYAILATGGLVFIVLLLPETRGRSLEEVEGLFARSWFSGLRRCCYGDDGDDDDSDPGGKHVQYVHIGGMNRSTSGSTNYDSP